MVNKKILPIKKKEENLIAKCLRYFLVCSKLIPCRCPFPLFSQSSLAAFDGGLLTSDSGVMLLREVGPFGSHRPGGRRPSAPRVCRAPYGGSGPSVRVSNCLRV